MLKKECWKIRVLKRVILAWFRGKTKETLRVDRPIKIRRDYTTSKHKLNSQEMEKLPTTHFKS